jgi:DNA-binding IclR family transcriptional regulator
MNVGMSYPLGVGAGTLAILAELEEPERERILSVTQSKLGRFPRISIELVREMTAETRERGFALSTGRIVPGAYSAAVPIFADGRPIGSFACAASAERLSGDRLDFVVRTMRAEAELVGQQLTGRSTSARARARPRDPSRAERRTGSVSNHDRAH